LRVANAFQRFILGANAVIPDVETEGVEVEFAITWAESPAGRSEP
jgi:hypothetical protein